MPPGAAPAGGARRIPSAAREAAAPLRHVLAQHGASRIEEASAMPYGWGTRRGDAHRRLRDGLRAGAKAVLAR